MVVLFIHQGQDHQPAMRAGRSLPDSYSAGQWSWNLARWRRRCDRSLALGVSLCATDLLFWGSNILTQIWSYLASPGIALVLPLWGWIPCGIPVVQPRNIIAASTACIASRSIWNLFGSKYSFSFLIPGLIKPNRQVEPSVPVRSTRLPSLHIGQQDKNSWSSIWWIKTL